MRIVLNEVEHNYLKQRGEAFRTKTGKAFSHYYMLSLLCQLYADRLNEDLDAVLDQKLREEKETQAETNKTNK